MRSFARPLRQSLAVLLATTLLGAGAAFAQASGARTAETGEPNAPDQEPAFAGQTRAPLPAEATAFEVETVAEGLPQLWSLEFLPDGRMLVAAKEGEMMILSADREQTVEVSGVPEVAGGGQGGLLDIALGPDFATDGMVYFSFSEPREGGVNGTSVARARLAAAGETASLEDVDVIFQQTPGYDGDKHFGSRIVFAPDGKLLLGVGERSDEPIRDQAQDLESGLGKVFRVNADGSVPEDNPFVGRDDAQDEIWSYGHRNIQSATLDGDGRLWVVEHGARGGDELNRPEAGKNYGWPVITYGIAYGGAPIGEGITQREGMEQPVYYWDPVIGPSGMAVYEGAEFPAWDGAVVIGGLVSQGLVVLTVEGDRVATEERIPLGARIRDVKVGPDGAIYAVTEQRGGGDSTILRIAKGA